MFRTLAILCLVAAPAFGDMDKGFKRTWGLNVFALGSKSFVDMPETVAEATSQGWENVTSDAPATHSGYENIQLWCPKNERVVCIIYDECNELIGKQIGIDLAKFSGGVFDWVENGFKSWTVTIDGESKNFQTVRQYYVSKEWLENTCDVRKSNRNNDRIIQDSLHLSSFNGELLKVANSVAELDTTSGFTQQACIPTMGRHHYYKATKDLACSATTILSWFILEFKNQITGVGFMLPGKYNQGSERPYFEDPGYAAIKMIVPTGPDCLWNYGNTPGVMTMHTYFVKSWIGLTCL